MRISFGASQLVLVVKNLPANVGDIREASFIPGWGISPEEGHDNLLQYSCLENPLDRRTWWAMVHRITKSQTWLKGLRTYTQLVLWLKHLTNVSPLLHPCVQISIQTDFSWSSYVSGISSLYVIPFFKHISLLHHVFIAISLECNPNEVRHFIFYFKLCLWT